MLLFLVVFDLIAEIWLRRVNFVRLWQNRMGISRVIGDGSGLVDGEVSRRVGNVSTGKSRSALS